MNKELVKFPPQATDIEELVIGAILLDSSAIIKAMTILKDDSFYSPANDLIFKACKELYIQRKPIDTLTVCVQLKAMNELVNIGGAYHITQLTNRISSSANIVYHCHIIEQNAIARRLINLCLETVNELYEKNDIFDVLQRHQIRLANSDISVKGNDTSPLYRMNETVSHIEQAMKGMVMGVSTGYKELDRFTGGWQNGDLIIVASRPGMGKSALAINLAHHAVIQRPVFMHQMEMTAKQVGMRELSMITGVTIQSMRTGNVFESDFEAIKETAREIEKMKFIVDFESGQNMFSVQSKIIKAKQEHDICMAFVDYLQLIEPPKSDKNTNLSQAIGVITSSFKRLAKELDIPIMLFCQLNREVEKRTDRRPQLSDLRDSGSIEADADMVIMLMRPDYYDENAVDKDGKSLVGKIDLIIAKNRQGSTGDVWLRHDLSTNRIMNDIEIKEPIKDMF